MASKRAALGVQLWRLYAEEGKLLPASWVARAVGVSPTTMGKHLAVEGYAPVRGFTPGRGWNWSKVTGLKRFESMAEYMISNGHKFEVGPEADLTEEEQEGCLLDFLTAMTIACDGMAVARTACCKRAIFREAENGPLQVGSFDEKTGLCTSTGKYEPTLEDFQTQDWMLLACWQ